MFDRTAIEVKRRNAIAARAEANRLEEEAKAAQAQYLADDFLNEIPKSVTDRVYQMAYNEGHSSGDSEIEYFYEEYASLALMVWDEAKK